MMFLMLCVYLEIIYHLFCFGFTSANPMIALGILCIVAGAESFIVNCFQKRTKKTLIWVLALLDVLIYATQLVYFKIFKQPLLISAVIYGAEDAVTNYWKETIYAIIRAGVPIVFMLLPLVFIGIRMKKQKKERKKSRKEECQLCWKS